MSPGETVSDSHAPLATDALSVQIPDYCREIEAYLCRKNDGHLIRVVGPSFDRVSRWAAEGVPLKIAFRGIDRCVQRYYRRGPRRRPVRVDFCEADVLDVFDEWRRAIGLPAAPNAGDPGEAAESDGCDGAPDGGRPRERASNWPSGGTDRGPSLPAHLERALLRLTEGRVTGVLGPWADGFIDRASRELDLARALRHGLRGEARRTLVDRLAALDAELLHVAEHELDESQRLTLEREADEELLAFRDRLAADAYARVRQAAMARLVRERFGLPVLILS